MNHSVVQIGYYFVKGILQKYKINTFHITTDINVMRFKEAHQKKKFLIYYEFHLLEKHFSSAKRIACILANVDKAVTKDTNFDSIYKYIKLFQTFQSHCSLPFSFVYVSIC